MSNWQQFIEQVKQNNDIVSVISSYITVVTRGHTHWARCPFHGEREPSFAIDRRGFYKCFGCGETGDVISFVQKFESCTFYEAVEILARRANMTMPEKAGNDNSVDIAAKKKNRDVEQALLREAALYYRSCYNSSVGEKARKYMSGRGVSNDTQLAFGIGYSPDMNGLTNHLRDKSFSLDKAVELGVLNKRNGRYYDAMANRLIIPIISINNKVIAFGGRALDEQTNKYGKYKNTSESPQFIKSNNVFGLNIVKKAKQNSNLPYIIMVEGYMDVIAMYQAGYPQCVASMGTSLTQQQAKTIARLSSKVYICYDGDSAGIKATVRGLDILQQEQIDVSVVSVPEGLDPDEYIGKYGKDKFDSLFAEALPLVDFKLKYLYDFYKLDDKVSRNANMPKYVKQVVVLLKQLSEEEQQQYAAVVAKTSGYSKEWILGRLVDEPVQSTSIDDSYTADDKAIFAIVSYLLTDISLPVPNYRILTQIEPLQIIIDYIYDCRSRGEMPDAKMIFTISPKCSNELYAKILPKDEEVSQQDIDHYGDCVAQVHRVQLLSKRKAFIEQLADIPLDSDKGSQLQKEINEITQAIKELKIAR